MLFMFVKVIAITSLSFVKQSPLRWATRVGVDVDVIKELVQEGASLDLQDGVTTTSVILTSQTLYNIMEPLNEGHTLGTLILSLVENCPYFEGLPILLLRVETMSES